MSNSLTFYRAPMLPGGDLGNVTTETFMPDGRSSYLQLALPSNGKFVNSSFRVRVAGRVSATISNLFEIKVYFGMNKVIANNTLIFDSGLQSISSLKSNFEFWLDMQWDNDSKSITGRGAGSLANWVLGPTTLINTPLSADPNRDSNTFLQSGVTYGFTVTGLFNSASPGNHAFVDTFALEAV